MEKSGGASAAFSGKYAGTVKAGSAPEELMQAIYATGTPTAVLLVNGRRFPPAGLPSMCRRLSPARRRRSL
jgi:hypothetical protein